MEVRKVGKSEKFEEKEISLEEVIVPENVQRKHVGESKLAELANSIREVGLLQPIVVRRARGGYELIAGYRRYLAHVRNGADRISARVVRSKTFSVAQATLDENLARADVNPVDEALWLARLQKESGATIDGLARAVGKSAGYVSERLAILSFSDDVIGALAEERIGLSIARELAKCNSDEERARLLEVVCENGATARVVKYWVQSANARADFEESSGDEGQPDAPEPEAYEAPKIFCDLCEQETDYMHARMIRVCPSCFKIAKANLKE